MIKLHLDGNKGIMDLEIKGIMDLEIKGIMDLEIKGNLPELIADTMTVIYTIYSTIQEQNKMEAEYYKQCILSKIETAFIHDDEMLKVALDNKTESTISRLVEVLLIDEPDKPNETIIDEQLLAELRKAKLDENS